jgi:hypothetical protein
MLVLEFIELLLACNVPHAGFGSLDDSKTADNGLSSASCSNPSFVHCPEIEMC